MAEDVIFNTFITKGLKIEKEDSEKRTFSGHITAEVVDKQDEYVTQEETMKSMDSWLECGAPLSDSHTNRIVGKGLRYEKSEYEGVPTVKIHGQIYKRYELHDKIWKEMQSGEKTGLSIGGALRSGKIPIIKDGRTVLELRDFEVYEIAICKEAANQLAIIDNVNQIAKSYDLQVQTAGERNIIQCNSIDCLIKKAEYPEKVTEAVDTINKFFQLGPTTAVSNENLASQDPPNTAKPPKTTTKYISNTTNKYDMDEADAKKVEPKEEKKMEEKDDMAKTSDVISLITQSITKQNEIIEKQGETLEKQGKVLEEITSALKKENPAGEGKVEGSPGAKGMGSGTKEKLSTEYQGGEDNSGINKPDKDPGSPDKVKIVQKEDEMKDEKKMEDEKKMDEKPKEIEKSAQDPSDKDNPNEIIKMDNGYEFVKTSTPRPATIEFDYSKTPTGYDIYKAVENGWGGKYDNYDESLGEMYELANKGAFGSGEPTGALN